MLQRVFNASAIVGMDQFLPAPEISPSPRPRFAPNSFEGRVEIFQLLARRIDDPENGCGIFRELPKTRLAFRQGLLGFLALGHIAGRADDRFDRPFRVQDRPKNILVVAGAARSGR